jgi:predicted DNA-binding transcriptional regulator YafY
VVLTFLVFVVLVFVVYETTVGMGDRDLGDRSRWALIVAMVLLVLLPVVDRIREIDISPTGFKAKLSEDQAHALEEVGALGAPEVAEVARPQILQAKSPDQIQAATARAVKLNVTWVVDQVKEAIHGKRKCYVRYRPDPAAPVKTYNVAPLDIKPGKTPATRANDYLWAYSYEQESTVSLRLDRVLGVELSEETFDLVELMADWKQKEPEWNVPRDW